MPANPLGPRKFPPRKLPKRTPKRKEIRKFTPLSEALTPAQRVRFWRNFLLDRENALMVERRKRNRVIMNRELKAGNVLSEKVKDTRIFYNAQYRRFASKLAMRFGRRLEIIVRRGQVTADGTVARNTVYKVVVRGLSMARKTYLDVMDRAHSGLSEACALIEAKRRRVPVVDFVRLVINKRARLAVLYTLMPPGYKTLAQSRLGRAAATSTFLRELGRAVGKMHKAGMLHGDLDAENILWNGNPQAPDFIFLDLELARFFDRQPPFSEVCTDIGTLMESLTLERYGSSAYTTDELMHFVDAYCAETGYKKDLVIGVTDSASQPLQEVRDEIRRDILKRLGLE